MSDEAVSHVTATCREAVLPLVRADRMRALLDLVACVDQLELGAREGVADTASELAGGVPVPVGEDEEQALGLGLER